eukprot:351085-Chlamydomonas_euryale.AAC.1
MTAVAPPRVQASMHTSFAPRFRHRACARRHARMRRECVPARAACRRAHACTASVRTPCTNLVHAVWQRIVFLPGHLGSACAPEGSHA